MAKYCLGCLRLSRLDPTLGCRVYDGVVSGERVGDAKNRRETQNVTVVSNGQSHNEKLAFHLCQVCAYLFDNDREFCRKTAMYAALKRHVPPEASSGFYV